MAPGGGVAGGAQAPDLLEQLRPLAQDAVTTVRELSNIISRPAANNDFALDTDPLVKELGPVAVSLGPDA